MEISQTCPNCKGCCQCQYEVCDMTFREKKELDALRSAVFLDITNNVYRASYPEIDPDLEFKDNKWQAVAMSKSMEKHLKKTGMMESAQSVTSSTTTYLREVRRKTKVSLVSSLPDVPNIWQLVWTVDRP